MTSVCFLSGGQETGGRGKRAQSLCFKYKMLSAAPQAAVLSQGSSTEPQGQKNDLRDYFLSSP